MTAVVVPTASRLPRVVSRGGLRRAVATAVLGALGALGTTLWMAGEPYTKVHIDRGVAVVNSTTTVAVTFEPMIAIDPDLVRRGRLIGATR